MRSTRFVAGFAVVLLGAGAGQAEAGGFTVDVKALAFPDTPDFQQSASQAVTLTNGPSASTITAVVALAADGGVPEFLPILHAPVSVPAGGSVPLGVVFEPHEFGPRRGSIAVVIDDGKEELEIAATGTGLPRGPLEASGGVTDVDLGAFYRGEEVPVTLAVEGTVEGGVTLGDVVSDNPAFVVAWTTGFRQLGPHELASFRLIFTAPAVATATTMSATVRLFVVGAATPALVYQVTASVLPGWPRLLGIGPAPKGCGLGARTVGGVASALLLLAGPMALLLGRRRRR